MNILIMGPPLSGKGTQGQLLAERLNLSRLSVGALIRKLNKEKNINGVRAGKYAVLGKAIPGELLIKIIDPWLKKHTKGFVIDNLVRSEDQLKAFQKYADKNNLKIDKVIYITLPKNQTVKRLNMRINEHKRINKDRHDDSLEKLLIRIQVYESSKKLITDYFKKQNILETISGNHSVSTVHENILKKLNLKANGDN